ncbi:MAG: GDSL-type esterase/lipase family protein [Rikenellaceae bacterium]|nr:GDSL-type esterase/lipase family protein [Rikenellaceae bacterium]
MKSQMFRIMLAMLFAGALALQAPAQNKTTEVKFRGAYYDQRRAAHDLEGIPEGSVVFLGNSITEQGWWSMLFKTKNIVNRGIGGDNAYGMLDRLPDILKAKPSKMFLMCGINDISLKIPNDTIVANIRKMVRMTKCMAPQCSLYIESVLPINETRLVYTTVKGDNPTVDELNLKLRSMCKEEGVGFVDIASLLKDEKGELRLSLTKDGLHLHPEAYLIWAKEFKRLKLLK